jgi:putative tryptophan/tyrosine transport system substrate-binding protein
MLDMKRREFITLLGGGAAAWPLAAHAQQPERMRRIGYLSPRSAGFEEDVLQPAFRQGLSETGYLVGKNLTIECRWADGNYDRLPALAADLISSNVEVIVTTGGPQPFRAARALTKTIPVVFTSGSDPVADGLVDRLDRPGGNATGVHAFVTSLSPKRLEILRELVPKAHSIAFLLNPSSQLADMQMVQVQEAARALRQEIVILNASTESEIEAAFATLVQRGAGALLLSADTFFQVSRDRLVALASRYAVPVYEWPEFVRAGGLISYSTVPKTSRHQRRGHGNAVRPGAARRQQHLCGAARKANDGIFGKHHRSGDREKRRADQGGGDVGRVTRSMKFPRPRISASGRGRCCAARCAGGQ